MALPTDTVYGLAVSLDTPDGLERLFALKGRPSERAIAVLVAGPEQAATLGRLGPAATALAAASWPGGLTLVVPIGDGVVLPAGLTARSGTVGLRVPDHPAPRALAAAAGPLATTSANLTGQPELADAAAIDLGLGDGLDLILDGGPAGGGPASTVVTVDGTTTRILRSGAVGRERLADILEAAGLPAPAS